MPKKARSSCQASRREQILISLRPVGGVFILHALNHSLLIKEIKENSQKNNGAYDVKHC